MKNTSLFLLLTGLLLLGLAAGCNQRVTAPAVPDNGSASAAAMPEASVEFDQPVLVKVGQTTRVKKAPETAFTFVGVTSDSRCPTGVNCMQAGEAKVSIRVGDEVRTLTIAAQPRGSAARFGVPYGFVVVEALNPYPASGGRIAPEDYLLSVRFRKAATQ